MCAKKQGKLCWKLCFFNTLELFNSSNNSYLWAWIVVFSFIPASHVIGHVAQSLNGVMIQSFLQGSWHGLIVLGRGPSGHLSKNKISLYIHQNTRAWSLNLKRFTPKKIVILIKPMYLTKSLICGCWARTLLMGSFSALVVLRCHSSVPNGQRSRCPCGPSCSPFNEIYITQT